VERTTPKAAGYAMPAEWERHEATWLSWPKNPLTFPEDVIEGVEGVFARLIEALSRGEPVKVLVDDAAGEERMRAKVEACGANMRNVRPVRIKSADVWIRDYGPTFLLHSSTGKKAAVKWRFNAWGAKYDDLLYDDITGEKVVMASGVRTFRPDIVLEGGSVEVNGAGTVLTTEQCLLNKNRNPQLERSQIEKYLDEYLGTRKVIWLRSGIEGDDTDGHIDDFARFISPDTVLCAFSSSHQNANNAVLSANLKLLESAVDQDGNALQVRRLPMPKPLYLEKEERWLPASYANFYIGNRVVLLPVFDDPRDAKSISMLQECYPDREVVPIMAADLVYGYGGIHCVTQQEPADR